MDILHKVHGKDQQCQVNLRTATKLTVIALHPGNWKQNVPVALAVIFPSTIAAIQHYYPENLVSYEFIYIIYVWWTQYYSKSQFNSLKKLG